ncbi:MAG: biotin--[acetyl-CoA-carboxylase] ligase [Candidatus Eremiobacteraeota bacterium]|nr:biotin--[acetyl-CoA-carboxylase] ligase [Candidatus Eremiobacteraeota bacterium]
MDSRRAAQALGSLRRFGRMRYFGSVDSTNARALDVLHDNDCLGISFVTECQDKGRGRAGRAWIAPPGSGLLLSTILPAALPHAVLPAVGFWAALAVRDAVQKAAGTELQMKWPNDLLLGARKCGGILCEARSTGPTSRVVVGVGLNANRPQRQLPELPDAGWLSDAGAKLVDRTALLIALLSVYEDTFDLLVDEPREIIARWSGLAALDGKPLRIKSASGRHLCEGIARGVDPSDGTLLVGTSSGIQRITLGDVEALS